MQNGKAKTNVIKAFRQSNMKPSIPYLFICSVKGELNTHKIIRIIDHEKSLSLNFILAKI